MFILLYETTASSVVYRYPLPGAKTLAQAKAAAIKILAPELADLEWPDDFPTAMRTLSSIEVLEVRKITKLGPTTKGFHRAYDSAHAKLQEEEDQDMELVEREEYERLAAKFKELDS